MELSFLEFGVHYKGRISKISISYNDRIIEFHFMLECGIKEVCLSFKNG